MSILNNIYVVNLDRSKDRLNKIHKNLTDLRLKYKRFTAVDGKKLTDEEIKKHTTRKCMEHACTPGEIGTALSHSNLWKLIKNSNSNYALILEDDAILNKNTINIIKELQINLNKQDCPYKDFDIISLFCGGCVFHPDILYNKLFNKNFGYDLIPGIKIIKRKSLSSTVAYIVSKKGVNALLTHIKKIDKAIDDQMKDIAKNDNINYYTTLPNAVDHDFGESTIHSLSNRSIFLNILNFFNLQMVTYGLSLPLITIRHYTVNFYTCILLIVMMLNILFIKNKILMVLILVELLLYIY